jgi:hypothetical protein
MPIIRVIKKSRNVIVKSKNHPARKSKKSNKKNNKKRKASRKNKVLHGGAEHINEVPEARLKRARERRQKLLQMRTLQQAQTQAQVQAQQRPVESTLSNSIIITKLQNVLMRK